MPRYICKFVSKKTNKPYYLEWSTVVDAPVTDGMTLEEFTQYYQDEYGNESMRDFLKRMERTEKTGTSAIDQNIDTLIAWNRAGEHESSLTYDAILATYCDKETP